MDLKYNCKKITVLEKCRRVFNILDTESTFQAKCKTQRQWHENINICDCIVYEELCGKIKINWETNEILRKIFAICNRNTNFSSFKKLSYKSIKKD